MHLENCKGRLTFVCVYCSRARKILRIPKKKNMGKKKNIVYTRLCANFCPLSRDFWIFLWCVFFLQTGVSLRKPENLIFHSKGTLECFHTHTCDPTVESNRLARSKESREEGKEKKKKVGYRAPAALPVPTLLYV